MPKGLSHGFVRQPLLSIRSDIDGKGLIALGAAHGVLTLFLWQTKRGAAMGAFAVDMGLAVADLIALQLEITADLIPYFQKGAVFLLSAVDIAGEKAEHIKGNKNQLQDPKDPTFEEETDDYKRKIDPKECLVELVIAVSAVHEANELICKFAFLHENFLSCEILSTV